MSSSASDKSVSTDSGSVETQRLLLHRRDQQYSIRSNTWTSFRQGLLKLKSLCRFSKVVYLILTWTLIVGAIAKCRNTLYSITIHYYFCFLKLKYFYQQQCYHITFLYYTGCACTYCYALSGTVKKVAFPYLHVGK